MDWTERELREQTAWMKRIARALTGDADLAEDLTQDAWVATLDSRANLRAPRAWFRKVLQNRNANDRRSRGRRADRERDAAQPEALPAVDEAAQRVELQAKLAHAVFSLDEPYRQVITLRFLQGWKSRRIAAELNLQSRQVEVRLRQGLEKLRAKLDAACDGRREDWFSGVLAIGASGSHLGKTGALVCAGLLALGSSAFLPKLWQNEPSRLRPEPLTATLEAPRPEQTPGSETGLAPPARTTPDLRTSEARTRHDYRVTLVREGDSAALSGATVTIGRETMLTDDAGQFRIDRPIEKRGLTLHVTATTTTQEAELFVAEPGVHILHIPRRGGTLHGVVLDFEGEPIPLAEVRFFEKPGSGRALPWRNPVLTVRADGLGVFVADDLAGENGEAKRYHLLASTPGWLSAYALEGQVRAKGNDQAILFTEPARVLTGRVSAEDRTVIARAPMQIYSKNTESFKRAGKLLKTYARSNELRAWGKARRYPALGFESAADGRFEIPRALAGSHLQVDHPEYSRWRAWLSEEDFVDVVLEVGCRVFGRVLAADGSPVQGATVRLNSREKRKPTMTNARGDFEFQGLTPLKGAVLSVVAEGHAIGVLSVDVLRGGPLRSIRLEEERVIRGKLVDPMGKPLANQRVDLRGDRIVSSPWVPRQRGITWERWANAPSWLAWTNAAGEFEFKGLYPGSFRVSAERETWFSVPEGDEPIVVVRGKHEGAASLRGTVLGGVQRELTESYTITVTRFVEGETEPVQERIVRNFDSRELDLYALDPGVWQIEVIHAESQWVWSSEPEYLGPGEHSFTAVLRPKRPTGH